MTLQFGQPRLDITEPRTLKPLRSGEMRRRFARRRVLSIGEWRLSLYCCRWSVYNDGELIGDSTLRTAAKHRIHRAARNLDGQKLNGVSLQPERGAATFTFDLGSRLETRPYNNAPEQWILDGPSGAVFTWGGDGRYLYRSDSMISPNDGEWRTLDS